MTIHTFNDIASSHLKIVFFRQQAKPGFVARRKGKLKLLNLDNELCAELLSPNRLFPQNEQLVYTIHSGFRSQAIAIPPEIAPNPLKHWLEYLRLS